MIQRILNPTKALRTLRKTARLLAEMLADVSQAQARELRDGPDGWSVLVIACHLRDFEVACQERIELLLAQEHPTFPPMDQEALVELHAYAEQDLRVVLADLASRRAALIARIEGLDDDQWLRAGLHPTQGPGTLLDVAINLGLHDLDHLEQLSRCLTPLNVR